jgi:hypothetical protein
MKFIFCTCNVSTSEMVVNLLDAHKVSDYQITDRVIARSSKGTPRFDNPVWPGYNVIITMQFSDDNQADIVINALRGFNKNIPSGDDELISVCSWIMDNYITD